MYQKRTQGVELQHKFVGKDMQLRNESELAAPED